MFEETFITFFETLRNNLKTFYTWMFLLRLGPRQWDTLLQSQDQIYWSNIQRRSSLYLKETTTMPLYITVVNFLLTLNKCFSSKNSHTGFINELRHFFNEGNLKSKKERFFNINSVSTYNFKVISKSNMLMY